MAHYFDATDTKSCVRTVEICFDKHHVQFYTDYGVFSKDGLDTGSELLIRAFVKNNPENIKCLDLGCGLGVVGIICNKVCPSLSFDFTDVNERAVSLTQKNLQLNNLTGEVFQGDCLNAVLNKKYDAVIVNPPIRAGNQVIFRMFEQSYQVLNSGGKLFVVLRQKQGAKTYINKITQTFGNNNILAKDKGFVVCEFIKN